MSLNCYVFPFNNLNELELASVLDGVDNHQFPLSVIENLSFNRYNFNDRNFESDLTLHEPVCNYYFCDTLPLHQIPSNSLKILSYNISSIPLHLDTFVDQCLDDNGVIFDVIGFCETRLNDAISSIYKIADYTPYFKNKNTHGGGVAVFLKQSFSGFMLHNISLELPHIQSLFIQVTQPYSFIVGIIYRPPNSSLDEFSMSIEFICDILVHEKQPCYIMGDFNIDLLKDDSKTLDFINLLYSYHFFPTITKPTRVTSTTASLIDHVWTNNLQNHKISGIYHISISDHFPIFSMFSVDINCRPSHSITTYNRIYNNSSIEAFQSDLMNYNWISDMINNDVEKSFSTYTENFQQLYEKHFPSKLITCKEKHNKPYITEAIKKSIKHRNKLQKLYAKWPLTYGKIFKEYRNSLTSVIRSAKENYYKLKLENSSGNAKKTWDIINAIMGKSNSYKLPDSMSFQDNVSRDKKEIAESFNEYFCNIANYLAMNIQEPLFPYTDYLPEPVPFSFFLCPTSTVEVKTITSNLKLTAAGFDDINMKVITACINEIAPFLVYIINKSFTEGVFPQHLQIARVIPVHKKGDKSVHTNYRPISILPCFSKIFEKIVANRLLDYMSKHNILTEAQFGFRPNYSTDLALHKFCQNIHNTLDNKGYQISVFCDLSKAFDTISHSILLEKLKVYGIRGAALNWFQSYLKFRKQYTTYNHSSSARTTVTYGVPQGSILGPILFLLYINDITRTTDKLKFILFADDTTIFIQGQDLNYIKNTLNFELTKVSNWIKSNKLTLNISKTKFMVSSSLMMETPPIDIYIDNFLLQQVETYKFLGVIIDSKLKWKEHINEIIMKLSKLIGIFYKIRNIITPECLRMIYLSLAYPYFLYGSVIWGASFTTYLNNLFTTQKKMLRVMTNSPRYAHTDPLFKQFHLLKLFDIIALQTNLFVYKSLHNTQVECDFKFTTNPHARRQICLQLPLCRTSHAQRYLTYRGPKQWNQLPKNIKNSNSYNIFKNKLKQMYLNNY